MTLSAIDRGMNLPPPALTSAPSGAAPLQNAARV